MPFDASEIAELGTTARAGSVRVGAKFSGVIRKGAFDMQRSMQAKAAVDTGAMRASVSTTVTGDGRFGAIRAEVGPTVDYAIFVETGTSRMGPQPFVGPGFDETLPSIEAAVARLGGELLR